ncbi:hypothetical protein Thiowin_03979 [Thiorhodovibrio winogradskyi]|uniref:Uncharacterized protein n=1 Tax=Thiorhodovibrio winogradskyi TaxID=77007 RepID=A0ABZ0SE36_9GAMM
MKFSTIAIEGKGALSSGGGDGGGVFGGEQTLADVAVGQAIEQLGNSLTSWHGGHDRDDLVGLNAGQSLARGKIR